MTQFKRDYPRILVDPPGPKGQVIVAKDREFTSTSYIKEYPLVVSHGRGPYVEDVDGNRYIDFMAGIAVASTGYAHPEVVKATQEAAGKFFSMCSTDFYYDELSTFAERICTLAPGESKKRVFVTNSGTEAIEGAIKLVRNSTGRQHLIAFDGAFHGRSYGAMSLTSSKAKQRTSFGPFLSGVHHVPYPHTYRLETGEMELGEFVIKQIEALFEKRVGASDVAAIFIEPFLGEGGYVIPPKSFMKALRALCDKHGILLVFDEIQCGVGRSGYMWAADYFDVEPDVLLTAKGIASGMPIGAIVAKESIMKWPAGSHGSTYAGSPVCCAAANATLEVVERELVDNARIMGERLKKGMLTLQKKYKCIGDIRGIGLFIGVEFVKDPATKEPDHELMYNLEQLAFRKGLLLLGCGISTIRLAPPLIVDEYDVDTGLAILDECLEELTKQN